ncbi:MAG TPA: ribonuclease P protein subunit [Thermoplasmatales archaeon]|nr:ribonuclease P protein subunit [Thermoplasmatales archaeon]
MDSKALARDELIGLHVQIRECTDPTWNNVAGKIIDETKNTFIIETDDGKQKKIAKKTAKFEFNIEGKKIIIDGSKIVYRPEDRIKKVR